MLFVSVVVAIYVSLKSFIIVSTHCRFTESGFRFVNRMRFFTEYGFGFTMYPNPDSLIDYSRILTSISVNADGLRDAA